MQDCVREGKRERKRSDNGKDKTTEGSKQRARHDCWLHDNVPLAVMYAMSSHEEDNRSSVPSCARFHTAKHTAFSVVCCLKL